MVYIHMLHQDLSMAFLSQSRSSGTTSNVGAAGGSQRCQLSVSSIFILLDHLDFFIGSYTIWLFVQVSHTCTFPSLSSLGNRSSLATMWEEALPSFPCCTLSSAYFILSWAYHHLLLSFCSRRGKDIFIHNPSGLEWWLDLIRVRETLN